MPETVPRDVTHMMTTQVTTLNSSPIRQLELHLQHNQELLHSQEVPILMLHTAAIKTTFKCGMLQWQLNNKEVSRLKVSSVDLDDGTVTQT